MFQNKNIKISKILNLKKKKKKKKNYNSHIYNVRVMFSYEFPWFYQEIKSENLCFLKLYSVHAAKILDLSLEIMLSPQK